MGAAGVLRKMRDSPCPAGGVCPRGDAGSIILGGSVHARRPVASRPVAQDGGASQPPCQAERAAEEALESRKS